MSIFTEINVWRPFLGPLYLHEAAAGGTGGVEARRGGGRTRAVLRCAGAESAHTAREHGHRLEEARALDCCWTDHPNVRPRGLYRGIFVAHTKNVYRDTRFLRQSFWQKNLRRGDILCNSIPKGRVRLERITQDSKYIADKPYETHTAFILEVR